MANSPEIRKFALKELLVKEEEIKEALNNTDAGHTVIRSIQRKAVGAQRSPRLGIALRVW